MLKNYWKTAWRNIVHNKVFTTINILGLALGVCGCLALYLITSYELALTGTGRAGTGSTGSSGPGSSLRVKQIL